MNKYKIYAGSLILAFGLCAAMPVGAQNKKNKKKPKTAKAALIINIETTIVDENNNPIRHAEIIAGEGAISHFSDKAGKVSIQTKANCWLPENIRSIARMEGQRTRKIW